MPDKNRKFGQAPSGGTSTLPPEIPEFKKDKSDQKQNDRKAGALPIVSRSVGTVNVVGTVGRSVGSSGGFLGSGRLAALLSQAFGGSNTLLGSMFASSLGPTLALVAALSAAAGLIAAGVAFRNAMNGSVSYVAPQQSASTYDAPAQARPAPAPRPRGGPSGLFYINKEELTKPPELVPAAAEKVEDKKSETPSVPDAPKQAVAPANVELSRERIKPLSRDIHSWSTGGGAGGAGNHLTSSLPNTAPKFELASKAPGMKAPGHSSALPNTAQKRAGSQVVVQRGGSHNAMGQLKLARTMSTSGATTTGNEGARTYAADAFDQRRTLGGSALTNFGADPIVPPSMTAHDQGGGSSPPIGASTNETPYQPNVNNAQQNGNDSAAQKILGGILLALGAMLTAMGIKLMQTPATQQVGQQLLMMGIMMMIAGAVALATAQKKKQQGQQQAQQIGQQSGQKEQAKILNDCLEKAANSGQSMDNCHAPPPPQHLNTVHHDVEKERSADFHF